MVKPLEKVTENVGNRRTDKRDSQKKGDAVKSRFSRVHLRSARKRFGCMSSRQQNVESFVDLVNGAPERAGPKLDDQVGVFRCVGIFGHSFDFGYQKQKQKENRSVYFEMMTMNRTWSVSVANLKLWANKSSIKIMIW